jgi:2,4-dienoyl-CoA reductase-like NADH-dependent reductase (Old Yellow Enzyme family)
MSLLPLFTPLTVRGVTFRNRVMLAPMCQYRAVDGLPTRWHRSHHGRMALGGLGGALFEATAVLAQGRITPGCLGLWSDAHAEALREMVAAYHDEGTMVGIQLAHAGRKASATTPFEGAQPLPADDARAWVSVAPSALAFGPNWQVPHELSEAEIAAIIAAFAAAGRRAVAAGFDFVEIHAAHGYLINSFTSPIANHRSDGWGGEHRFRFATEIARSLRAALPDTMPIFCRISQEDGVEGGITLADSVALAAALKVAGVDVIDCSSGGISGPSGGGSAPPAPGYLVPGAARIRAEAGVATMAVGLIMDGPLANRIIADGSADLVAVGRELLADPAFVHRAATTLGHPDPHGLLPEGLGFWLKRRRWQDQGTAA